MDYEIRPIVGDEVTAFRATMSRGFGQDASPDGDERFLSMMPLDRTLAAFDGDAVVGTFGDFALRTTVPGGAQVATAGTTMVVVQATHTRRGILRAMMHRHLSNAAQRQEPIAALWASEPGIYGRFGYGLATESAEIKVDARHLAALPVPSDLDIDMVPSSEIPTLVAPFWSEIAQQRSGFIDRDEPRWQDIMNDPQDRREGGSAQRHVVVRRQGKMVGYVAYRHKSKWTDYGVPEGTIVVATLVGSDIDAHRALWAHVLDVDLFPHVEFWAAAIDDPLAYEVSNAREVRRTMSDGLYVRVLDLEAALTARTYELDGELVIAIKDDLDYTAGTYMLRVREGSATIERSVASADVTMDVRELASLYLGRNCADMYASTGLIRGSAAAVRTLGQLFATARAPWCSEMF